MTFRSDWDHLLGAARCGDVRALGELVEAAGEDLRTVASAVLGPTARTRLSVQAEDVFSDAVMAALREIGRLRATTYIGFRFWFASIARNHVRRSLRELGRRGETAAQEEADEEEEVDEVILVTRENIGFIRNALMHLPRSQQIAFVLRQGFGIAWRSVGFVLERRDPPAARMIHSRATDTVKQITGTRPEVRWLVIRA
jgi:RNA polymerase sigma factor (sigma-70 family)